MKRSKKFRWYLFPGIMFVFALAFSPYFVRETSASPNVPVAIKSNAAAQAADQKLIEKIGFYVLGITDLNVATGSYTTVHSLKIKCLSSIFCQSSVNGSR